MKKTSIIVKGTDTYETRILINNTAYVKKGEGLTGLLDVRTNKLLGQMRPYYTIYDENKKFYTQTWSDDAEEATNDRRVTSYIRIYDALNEKMVVEDYELVESFREYHEVFAGRSPKTGKLHLFDRYSCRNKDCIFNLELDEVKHALSRYNDTYYVLTKDSKKALYFSNCYDKKPKLLTGFEYDNIELSDPIFILTRNGKKRFIFIGEEARKSVEFDDLKIEEKNKNIAYGFMGNKIYVYNLYSKELILETEASNIKYLGKNGDANNEFNGDYFFSVEQNGKVGLMCSSLYTNANKQRVIDQQTILEAKYDEITRGAYSHAFYLRKGEKIGLLVKEGSGQQLIDAEYDDINNLKNNCYALINNSLATIKRITSFTSPKTMVEGVQEYNEVYRGYLYTKRGKKGLITFDTHGKETIIDPEYDELEPQAKLYFFATKNNKMGVISKGSILIPIQYDEIKMGGEYSTYHPIHEAKKLYFALKKNDKYELAKVDNYEYVDCTMEYVSNHTFNNINFYRNIMVLQDERYTYIYSYDEKLLMTLPCNTEVREVEKHAKNCDKKYLYYIEGKYYYFKDGKLIEEYSEEKDIYITKYETSTDIYEVRTSSQQEHDAFCKMIDEMVEAEAEQALQSYSEDKQKVKVKYPTVDINRESKNEE